MRDDNTGLLRRLLGAVLITFGIGDVMVYRQMRSEIRNYASQGLAIQAEVVEKNTRSNFLSPINGSNYYLELEFESPTKDRPERILLIHQVEKAVYSRSEVGDIEEAVVMIWQDDVKGVYLKRELEKPPDLGYMRRARYFLIIGFSILVWGILIKIISNKKQ